MFFASDTPILHPGGIQNPPPNARWLLWPAWCWRVLAPDLTERRMDPFSRVVARLCQAGIREPDRLATHTRLHRDLCNQILLLLQQQRLIDPRGNLTKRGSRALADEAWDASTVRLVHIFQHPFGPSSRQQLWPATMETLEYAHTNYRANGRPRLRLDSRRDSPTIDPVLVQTRDLRQPRQPDPAEVISSARQARTNGMGALDGSGGSDHPVQETTRPSTETQIARVCFISPQPDPVLLLTYIYLPDEAVTSTDWEVIDPFTGWPDPWLKESLQARAPDDARLGALIAEIAGQGPAADAAQQQMEHTRQRAEAAVKVERRLGTRIRMPVHRHIVKLLTYAEANLSEARVLDAVGGRHRQTAVNDVCKALEDTFATLSMRYPVRPALLNQLRDDVLGPIALKDGLSRARDLLGVAAPLPGGLQRQGSDQVARAAGGYLPSFRPVLVAALLASVDHTSHPLRAAVRDRPDLCGELDRVAGLRNECAHRQDREPTQKEAEDVLDLVYWTLHHLLLHPMTSEQGV